jgi:hypothetical protein
MKNNTGTQPKRPFLPVSQYQHRSNAGKDKMKRHQLSAFQPDLFNLDDAPVPPFRGDIGNPRVIRAVSALLRGVVDRADLATIAGCRNSPALVSDLRDAGLEVPCELVPKKDRDGFVTLIGRYYLTALDRMLVEDWSKRFGIKV